MDKLTVKFSDILIFCIKCNAMEGMLSESGAMLNIVIYTLASVSTDVYKD